MMNDLTADEKRKEWEQKYKFYIDNFIEFLKKDPNNIERSINHPYGKEILDRVKTFTTADVNNDIWFSARTNENVFDRGTPREHPGRFHYKGDIVIYFSEDKSTAMDECLQHSGSESFIQEFKSNSIVGILNMSHDAAFLDYAPSFELGIRSQLHFCRTHYFTQFVSYCARKNGFNGLIYSSALTLYRCLVLFNWTEKEITPINKSVLWIRRK